MKALIVSLVLLSAAPDGVPWYEHYNRAIELIEDGRAQEARQSLEAALTARPQAGLRVRTYGMSYVDYLPNLYLAVACHMSGDVAMARQKLAIAEDLGFASESEGGRTLLAALRVLLGESQAVVEPAPPLGAEPGYLNYERQEEVLAVDEFEKLKKRVLSRCQLSPDSRIADAPWYFHYELGLELSRAGDPQRALDAFVEAVERRPESSRQARVYGMWFKDYLPYFHIAQTHATLGNWECVADALVVSEQFGEVSPEDEEYFELRSLRSLIVRTE